jgi:TRAP-type C4-dicarboxylate transport system substrate-binding protein
MRRVRLSISRRAIMVTLATLAFAPEVALAQEFELKVSHFLPPNHTFQKELTRWGEELEKASGRYIDRTDRIDTGPVPDD